MAPTRRQYLPQRKRNEVRSYFRQYMILKDLQLDYQPWLQSRAWLNPEGSRWEARTNRCSVSVRGRHDWSKRQDHKA